MMKWFVGCLIVIIISLCVLLIQCTVTFHLVVDDKVSEYHRNNLLVLYDIKE